MMVPFVFARPRAYAFVLMAFMCLSSCGQQTADHAADVQPKPQQAGQPVSPLDAATHIAKTRLAVATGNQKAAAGEIKALSDDVMRSARVPDVSRPVNHEAARAAVRSLDGVRSVLWLDTANFVVMVDGQRYRSMAMIDRVCVALEPLGDTLSVVVNLQDAAAKNGDEAMTLSRNCQLPEGQRAFLQAKRQVDVISPELRAQFKAQQTKK